MNKAVRPARTDGPAPKPDQPLTSHDIARLAGVSQATVSRVLQGHQYVSQATRDKVLKVLESTQYIPNQQARAMRMKRTGGIGILTGKISNPFYPALLTALMQELEKSGSNVLLWSTDTASGEEAALEAIRSSSIDGLIFTTATENSESLKQALSNRLPVVLVNRSIAGVACDQVTSDNYNCGADIAEYFHSYDRKCLAVIGGSSDITTSRDRRRGFIDRAAKNLTPVSEDHQPEAEISYQGGFQAALEIMQSSTPPDAIFCVNDVTAFGARDAAESLGLRTPEDVWIVGFDDIEISSWPRISLSTVRQPISEMTTAALQLLMRRLEDPNAAYQHIQFREAIIPRETTAFSPFIPATL